MSQPKTIEGREHTSFIESPTRSNNSAREVVIARAGIEDFELQKIQLLESILEEIKKQNIMLMKISDIRI